MEFFHSGSIGGRNYGRAGIITKRSLLQFDFDMTTVVAIMHWPTNAHWSLVDASGAFASTVCTSGRGIISAPRPPVWSSAETRKDSSDPACVEGVSALKPPESGIIRSGSTPEANSPAKSWAGDVFKWPLRSAVCDVADSATGSQTQSRRFPGCRIHPIACARADSYRTPCNGSHMTCASALHF